MAVTLLISLMMMPIITGLSNESCLLSAKTSKLSWIVSIRKRIDPNINNIVCVGLIISGNQIFILSKCLSQKTQIGYYTGTELKALTGIDENSCIQTRDGVNYESLRRSAEDRDLSPSLLRYVAKLQVNPFNIEEGHEPSGALRAILPDNEEHLRLFMGNIVEQNVTCKIPIFGPDNGQSNKIKQEHVYPIQKEECEIALCGKGDTKEKKSCIRTLWAPDTHSCLIFAERDNTCAEYNMGTPILCTDLVCGVLKQCAAHRIIIMQLLTVEHLNALDNPSTPTPISPTYNATCKQFTEAIQLRTWGSIIDNRVAPKSDASEQFTEAVLLRSWGSIIGFMAIFRFWAIGCRIN